MTDDLVASMLGGLTGGGWDDLDLKGSQFAQASEGVASAQKLIADKEAALSMAVFGTPEGKALLDLLIRKTLLRPPSDEQVASRASAEAYAIANARREGQNEIIFTLLGMLQHGSSLPKTGGDL